MKTTPPKALQFNAFFNYHGFFASDRDVAIELRRLYAVNSDLVAALQPFILANSSEDNMILVVRTADITKARAAVAKAGEQA